VNRLRWAKVNISVLLATNAWFPPFHYRSSVAISPFCRCKIPFCKNYVRKFRSVTTATEWWKQGIIEKENKKGNWLVAN